MGTDDIGRDLYSRVVHGARISLFVALVAVLVGDFLGAAWGVAAGYIGGRFDIYSQRFLELMMSFPTLILAMILVLAMGAGVWTVIVAISITRVPNRGPGDPVGDPEREGVCLRGRSAGHRSVQQPGDD